MKCKFHKYCLYDLGNNHHNESCVKYFINAYKNDNQQIEVVFFHKIRHSLLKYTISRNTINNWIEHNGNVHEKLKYIVHKEYMSINTTCQKMIIQTVSPASTIRPVSPASHWPPTVFLPPQRLLQKDAESLVGSRRSNPRCAWQLRLTQHSRWQSELQSHTAQKTSTWSPASASGTGWRSGTSNHFGHNLEQHMEAEIFGWAYKQCQEYGYLGSARYFSSILVILELNWLWYVENVVNSIDFN